MKTLVFAILIFQATLAQADCGTDMHTPTEPVIVGVAARGVTNWKKHAKRFILIGTTLFTLAQVPQTIHMLEPYFEPQQQVQTLTPLEQDVVRESQSLMKGIQYQLKQPNPKQDLIAEMRADLANLHAQSPNLVGPVIP